MLAEKNGKVGSTFTKPTSSIPDHITNDSDLKVEIRSGNTGGGLASSGSNTNEAIDETDRWDHEVVPSNTGAGVPNAYRYSADYIEPTFPPKHVSRAD